MQGKQSLVPALAVARGATRFTSQILNRGVQSAVHGTARCMSQVLDRSAQADARPAMRAHASTVTCASCRSCRTPSRRRNHLLVRVLEARPVLN
jgi:hypothetical protein